MVYLERFDDQGGLVFSHLADVFSRARLNKLAFQGHLSLFIGPYLNLVMRLKTTRLRVFSVRRPWSRLGRRRGVPCSVRVYTGVFCSISRIIRTERRPVPIPRS